MQTRTYDVGVVPVYTRRAEITISPAAKVKCHIGLGISEIALRVICVMFCIAVLVSAAIALSTINDVDDFYDDYLNIDDYDYDYEYDFYEAINSYRGAAEWLLCISSLGIIFHPAMVFARYIFYIKLKRHFWIYAILNAILCGVFALSFLAGGVVNAIYADDNADLVLKRRELCEYVDEVTTYRDLTEFEEFCEDIKRVRDSQAAAASFSFFTMVVFAALTVIMIIIGVIKLPESLRQQNNIPAATTNHAPTYVNNPGSQLPPSQFASSQFVPSQLPPSQVPPSHFPPSSYLPQQKPVYPPTTAPPPYAP